ncbi:MAG: DNA-3-methyladenine glycosylase [Candidatus Rokubacteria bacterium]|nr:DNA-3-methyladenine glycosylase [Candidatus Rokubacteria bacterium]
MRFRGKVARSSTSTVGSSETSAGDAPGTARPFRQAPGSRLGGSSAGHGPLRRAFYLRPAPEVARDLLGCLLVSRLQGALTAGRIVETEAYLGPEDAASHAAFRPSARELFYGPGGVAYVFQAYGLHACLNAIAGPRGVPGCVLIRALQPMQGHATMARRRGLPADALALSNGPAKLTEALGITRRLNGADLTRGPLTIWPPPAPRALTVATGLRIGITRAADRPLRFWIRDNRYVSRPHPA